MLAELLMHKIGFTDIWYAHPGAPKTLGGRWHAGHWTGPDGDLICVKICLTKQESEYFLSPDANSILGAILKAWWKRHTLAYPTMETIPHG